MFGSEEKIKSQLRGLMTSEEFRGLLNQEVAGSLSRTDANSLIARKIDDMFASMALIHKLTATIEAELSRTGVEFIQKALPSYFARPDIQQEISFSVASSVAAEIDAYTLPAVQSALQGQEIRGAIRERVAEAVASDMQADPTRELVASQMHGLIQTTGTALIERTIQQELEKTRTHKAIRDTLGAMIQVEVDRQHPKVLRFEQPDGTLSLPTVVHKDFERVLRVCTTPRANVLLVGPAGSGKTQMAMDVAKAFGRPFYYNGPIQSEYKLLGFRDATGTYAPTPFYNAYTGGGVYLFDELDASAPQALVALNTAIANRYCDFPGVGEPVAASPNFVCIAAANTFGRGANNVYVGRNQLDAATLDRFVVIYIDYDTEMERALAGDDTWVAQVQAWRARAAELSVRHVISMRASIMGAELLRRDVPPTEVEEMVVWRGLDPNTVAKIRR